MGNLTITVDGHVLERARARALALGTSVNAVLRQHLEAFAGADVERSGSGSRGRRFTRDELHER